MIKDLVSIIIPTYNDAHYLEKCLDDLLEQTYTFFEVLIINDGSTDNTEEVVNKYCKKDSRFKLFSKSNGGTGSALNLGFENAKGEFGTWISSDDRKEPNMIEELVTFLKNNRDIEFVGLVALKCACILDESTFRTKLALEGIRASLGSASLSIAGNISGYKTLLDQGPCALFEQLTLDYNIGNASAIAAILSPFVGNEFDPKYGLRGAPINGGFFNDFYS